MRQLGLWLFAAAAMSGQQLVRIPAGAYPVKDEITTLTVNVQVNEFLISATEITQKEYETTASENPSFYKGADRPVENVSWWDAIRYCNRRSVKEGLTPCYDPVSGKRDPDCQGYRLPTEAEWTRAGAGATPAPADLRKAAHLGIAETKSTKPLRDAMDKGTLPAQSLASNEFGVYDIRGNVWEWCDDFFDVVMSPDAVRDPLGPQSGIARVIRGGSFVSTTSSWSRNYRSSMDPKVRSRFTGFRVARSVPKEKATSATTPSFFEPYNKAPKGFESSIGSLTPLVQPGSSQSQWKETADRIRSKWADLLSEPKPSNTPVRSRLIREVSQRNFSGRMLEIEVEPGIWEKVYVLEPSRRAGKLPVMIVPFYDIDTPAATDLGGRNYAAVKGVNAFAYTAAQHGYLAIAIRWFGESYGESYSEAVANLAARHPGSTGLGKWVADARRVCDFIETLPNADASRIGIIGHSLGGKMALYASAFEPRIRAVVSSELGVGFKFSNYGDYWYLGEKLATAPAGTDQHELIGLIAPRPFLLIGGDEYDKSESWHYINAARVVYKLFDQPQNVGYFNHHTGHTPSPDSVSLAFNWLDHFLLPE